MVLSNDLWPYVNPSLSEVQVRKIEKETPYEKKNWGVSLRSSRSSRSRGDTILDLTGKDVARYELGFRPTSERKLSRARKRRLYGSSCMRSAEGSLRGTSTSSQVAHHHTSD
jgi:hypothetical protein